MRIKDNGSSWEPRICECMTDQNFFDPEFADSKDKPGYSAPECIPKNCHPGHELSQSGKKSSLHGINRVDINRDLYKEFNFVS